MPTSTVLCSNAAKTRNLLKLAVVPQTNKTISAASRPKFTILWGHVGEILLFNKLFPIVDTCLSCEEPDKVVQWCPDGEFLAIFCILHFQRAACSTFQTCILNSHYGHTMCGTMVGIQSAAAEIRRGIKEEERKKPQGKNNMSAFATQGCHNYSVEKKLCRFSHLFSKLQQSCLYLIMDMEGVPRKLELSGKCQWITLCLE